MQEKIIIKKFLVKELFGQNLKVFLDKLTTNKTEDQTFEYLDLILTGFMNEI